MNVKIQRAIGSIKLGAKRNAPEILLGFGLVTGTACVVMTGKATVKANMLTNDLNNDKVILNSDLTEGFITEEDAKAKIKGLYLKYAVNLAKEYAVPATLYAATVATVFASYKIQKNRQMALSAALTACTTAYATLLGKLKNGAENGLTAKEVLDGVEVRETVNEDGEVIKEKVQGEAVGSLYKVRFDRYATGWENDRFQNESTLKSEENWANHRLQLEGFVFLNDIFDRLGLPKTKAGQIVGWKLNSDGDGYIDFGVVDAATYDDVRYDSNAFDLDFNVDGDILSTFK